MNVFKVVWGHRFWLLQMSYHSWRVPVEIAELIIDEVSLLDDEYVSALKACALGNIRTIGLCSDLKTHDWDDFTPDLKQALHKIVLSPIIEDLTLARIHNLPPTYGRFIICFPTVSLRKVHIRWQYYPELLSALPDTDDDRRKITLKTLIIDNLKSWSIMPLLDALSDSECKPERLVVKSYSFHNITVALDIMKRAKSSLTTLECLSFDTERDDSAFRLDIGILPHLKTVKVLADFEDDMPLLYMLKILSNARRDGNEIQQIIVEFKFGLFGELVTSNRYHWESLDDLLSGSRFMKLQKVCFILAPLMVKQLADRVTPQAIESVTLLLGNFLPTLRERGLLQLDDLGFHF
ncbi:hypothetical protein BDQ17DRAFT_1367515 [Cyathus striatus]|nr:hypothetical protein BDQ17DRAFT_1367515 [Cyathus striatus]